MSVDALLSNLAGVRRTGDRRWIARCPAHDDRTPSLSIRELADGRVLINDFGGCGAKEVLSAIGLTFDALFPPKLLADHVPRERRAFIPSDVLEVARREIGVVVVIASDMHKHRELSEADYRRLLLAVERLNDIAEAAYAL